MLCYDSKRMMMKMIKDHHGEWLLTFSAFAGQRASLPNLSPSYTSPSGPPNYDDGGNDDDGDDDGDDNNDEHSGKILSSMKVLCRVIAGTFTASAGITQVTRSVRFWETDDNTDAFVQYEKVSVVPESRVWFASKNLTPSRMH